MQPTNKTLKRVQASMTKCQEILGLLIQDREEYVDDRSEQWQESEKCDDYIYMTSEIETLMNDIYALEFSIDELINEGSL